MGKRSEFERIPKDKYYTWDARAYPVLFAHLGDDVKTFAEPCAGGGNMIMFLEDHGLRCVHASDIEPDEPDGLVAYEGPEIRTQSYETIDSMDFAVADVIITNPPWGRKTLHPFLEWCRDMGKPAWLLLDSNWAFTKQAQPYLVYCDLIVPTPRLKWIPDSDHAAKDDTSWYRFQPYACDTIFKNVPIEDAGVESDVLDLI